jgi:hypothetical protein
MKTVCTTHGHKLKKHLSLYVFIIGDSQEPETGFEPVFTIYEIVVLPLFVRLYYWRYIVIETSKLQKHILFFDYSGKNNSV